MNRRVYICLVVVILVLPKASYAYSVMYDNAAFSRVYTNPSVHIDFETPSHFTGESGSGYQTVYEDAFSSVWNFQSDKGSSGGYWLAVRWDGTGISSDSPTSDYLDIKITGTVMPFTLMTNMGFLAIVPDARETFLRLGGVGVTYISDFKSGYTATPIPSAVWLLGFGLVGLIGLRRKKTA